MLRFPIAILCVTVVVLNTAAGFASEANVKAESAERDNSAQNNCKPKKNRQKDKQKDKSSKKESDNKAKQKNNDKPETDPVEQNDPKNDPKSQPKDKPHAQPKNGAVVEELPNDKPQPKANKKPPASKAKDLVATDPSQADEDFAIQGEFMGHLSAGPYVGHVGLQVIALGDGKFDAVLYPGGLPGNYWNRKEKLKFSGQREGDVTTLQGDGFSVTLVGLEARFHNDDGSSIGTLEKVRRRSPTLNLPPPAGAKVLFNGTSTEHFDKGKMTPEGHLMAGPLTAEPVGDFRMHIEFRLPYKPHARGQGRGNSGVYIQERYEVQVLDSFGLDGVFNECGALYRQRPPDVNMCLPPLAWQTYDIWFQAARFDKDGNKKQNARITVKHNGIKIHDDVELPSKTGAGKPEEPTKRPIRLQDHGNPVVFRNIWMTEGDGRYYKPCPAPATTVISPGCHCCW